MQDERTADRNAGGVPQGTRLNGIYEIERLIANGGMGEVYRGHNIQTQDLVAIKMILPELAHNPDAFALFKREASTLHNLHHEAIVRYFVFSVDPDLARAYLAMEYVEGPSLAALLARGPLPIETVRLLQWRVADALETAHRYGIIHRDISSDNIILPDGDVRRAKIIDFGIARSQRPGDGTIIAGGFAGKYNYVSPEQLGLAGGDVTPKSDIYSLGLVLAEALLGQPLDMSGNHAQVVEKRRTVPDLSGIAPAMRGLIEAMLQPLPANRPESMAMVAAWGQPSVPPPPFARQTTLPPSQPLPVAAAVPAAPPRKRAGRRLALGALVLVLAGAGAVMAGPGLQFGTVMVPGLHLYDGVLADLPVQSWIAAVTGDEAPAPHKPPPLPEVADGGPAPAGPASSLPPLPDVADRGSPAAQTPAKPDEAAEVPPPTPSGPAASAPAAESTPTEVEPPPVAAAPPHVPSADEILASLDRTNKAKAGRQEQASSAASPPVAAPPPAAAASPPDEPAVAAPLPQPAAQPSPQSEPPVASGSPAPVEPPVSAEAPQSEPQTAPVGPTPTASPPSAIEPQPVPQPVAPQATIPQTAIPPAEPPAASKPPPLPPLPAPVVEPPPAAPVAKPQSSVANKPPEVPVPVPQETPAPKPAPAPKPSSAPPVPAASPSPTPTVALPSPSPAVPSAPPPAAIQSKPAPLPSAQAVNAGPPASPVPQGKPASAPQQAPAAAGMPQIASLEPPRAPRASLAIEDAVVGSDYFAALPPFGGGRTGPLTLRPNGALPDGLVFSDRGGGFGVISGRPSRPGRFAFDIVASNAGGASATMVTQIAVVAAPTKAKPAPQAPSATQPPKPAALPTKPPQQTAALPAAERIESFVRNFDGGPCFFVRSVAVSAASTAIEGFGSDVAPFERLDAAFRGQNGFSPLINVRRVTADQCPAIDLVAAAGPDPKDAPDIELKNFEVDAARPLAGEVRNVAGRHLALLLVTNDGQALNLERVLAPTVDGASFTVPLTPDAQSAGAPQLVIALATQRPLASLAGFKAGTAGDILPRIAKELKETGGTGLDARLFKLGN